jgi:tRNA threonylcarbamoyladenosine biosynthesis protein TsaE
VIHCRTTSPEETQDVAKTLAQTALPGTILCFSGDLGAGKTTFIKGFISELIGVPEEEITSPTFVYLHQFSARSLIIYHFDLYRLESSKDFSAMGFGDYLEEKEAICCIEWAEKISPLLPKRATFVKIGYGEQNTREITIEPHV